MLQLKKKKKSVQIVLSQLVNFCKIVNKFILFHKWPNNKHFYFLIKYNLEPVLFYFYWSKGVESVLLLLPEYSFT